MGRSGRESKGVWRRAARVTMLLVALGAAGCAGTSGPITATGADMAACSGAGCSGACASDADCHAGLKCDPVSQACVACLKDADCAADSLCQVATHTCARGCSRSRGCPDDGGVCELDAGICLECGADSDCADHARPRCYAAAGRCVACLPAPATPNCARGTYCGQQNNVFTCLPGCAGDADCGDGSAPDGGSSARCDLQQHRCVDCAADKNCPVTQICANGNCVDGCSVTHPCANGLSCCNQSCTDPTSDAQNCGACGMACKGGWLCCSSTCFNPANDAMNCGGCGVGCAVGHGKPACLARSCAVGTCDAGWADCNGVYRDGCETHVDTNVNNCGACGNACGFPHAFPACAGGACVIDTCLYPFDDCNKVAADGCEINTNKDLGNCGGCGQACNLPNASPACQQGACAIASCNAGFADCNSAARDGCEVAITTDLVNCGGCGRVCGGAHAQASCAMGACLLRCDAGWGNCDMMTPNGCEVNLSSDVMNCGMCGTACVGAHAQESCATGACRVTSCDFGWGDCNGDPRDGCETNLVQDAANCGKCKAVCSNNHVANPTCGVALCNGVCDGGFADCNGDKLGDGCETGISMDLNNCGACGKVCPAPPNAVAGCANSMCGVGSCNANFGDCDKNAANGCEVNLLVDANNCGACGMVCPNAEPCVGGVCQAGPNCGAMQRMVIGGVVICYTNQPGTCQNAHQACEALGLGYRLMCGDDWQPGRTGEGCGGHNSYTAYDLVNQYFPGNAAIGGYTANAFDCVGGGGGGCTGDGGYAPNQTMNGYYAFCTPKNFFKVVPDGQAFAQVCGN